MKSCSMRSKAEWLAIWLTGALLLGVWGCSTIHPAVSPEQMAAEPMAEQVLSPGDVVELKFTYNSEMNDTQRIRPDGNITLRFIGDVKAQGKEPGALQQELIKLYTPELKNPSLIVSVKSLRNNLVFVGGEVVRPGNIEMPGRLTAFEAISHAGGFKTQTAAVDSVVVIRSRNGKHYGTRLNFKDILAGKEVHPFYLRPSDVVFVPQTTIAKIDQWVDQHINRILPRVPISLAPTM
jgi:protein involved in polysaccharide export with SLBB domain